MPATPVSAGTPEGLPGWRGVRHDDVPMLRLDLPAEPTAIAQARDALDALSPVVGPELLLDLRLLVSEVVTNAVRHAGTSGAARVLLVAVSGRDCIRIEVHDEGVGFVAPTAPVPRVEGTSGWGLFLVEKLARAWGSEPAPDPYVWFELATA